MTLATNTCTAGLEGLPRTGVWMQTGMGVLLCKSSWILYAAVTVLGLRCRPSVLLPTLQVCVCVCACVRACVRDREKLR